MALSEAECPADCEPIAHLRALRPLPTVSALHAPIAALREIDREGPETEGVLAAPLLPDDERDRNRSSTSRNRPRSVVVILPALNEEMAVGSVIRRIPTERLQRLGYDVRIWVVDGKSTDATLQVARDNGASVYVQDGEGKGNGVRQALDHLIDNPRDADGRDRRMFVMLDADGSYPPEAIPNFVEELESGSDVVTGSRFLGHAEDGSISTLNRLGNRLLSHFAGFLFGVPVSDVCTGMWGFREDYLRRFGLAAKSFDLEADLFASSCHVGAHRKEVPIDYACRIGEAKLIPLRTGLLIAWRLIARRLNQPEGAKRQLGRATAYFGGEAA
jgi:dolichol-phosphate mannosyltransferase